MKKGIVFLIFISLLAACNDSDKAVHAVATLQDTLQEAETDAAAAVVQQAFPSLFQYLKKQDSTFSEDSFLLSGEGVIEPEPPAPLDTARLRPFRNYLIYNSDSSRALDLYSYNYIVVPRNGNTTLEEGSPDSEAAVLDFRRGTRKRIFFGGPAQAFWDGKWISATELLLIGAEMRDENKAIPTIWQVNLQDTSMQVYAYPGEIKADVTGYRNAKLHMGF